MRILAPALVIALVLGCKQPDPPAVTARWTDSFDRPALGGDYFATSSVYRVADGALGVAGAYNHPLWLRRKLPRDAVIELNCWSNSAAGDIKVEAWGDGESHAHDKGAYTSSGYVFVMGGWGNSKSILARGNEHGSDLAARAQPKVEVGRKYHWKIVRRGGRIEWYVDDMSSPFLALDDPNPLAGDDHAYFGFNNWESNLWFDDLSITPLP